MGEQGEARTRGEATGRECWDRHSGRGLVRPGAVAGWLWNEAWTPGPGDGSTVGAPPVKVGTRWPDQVPTWKGPQVRMRHIPENVDQSRGGAWPARLRTNLIKPSRWSESKEQKVEPWKHPECSFIYSTNLQRASSGCRPCSR